MDPIHAGAVIYAKDLARAQAFYEAVSSLTVEHVEDDHVILRAGSFQIVLLKMPDQIASLVKIQKPAKARNDTPIKLVFLSQVSPPLGQRRHCMAVH
jgi:catechol-2,3-dioxygenase